MPDKFSSRGKSGDGCFGDIATAGRQRLPGRKRFIARPIGTEFDRCFDCRISSRPLPIVFCRTRPSFRSSSLLITLALH